MALSIKRSWSSANHSNTKASPSFKRGYVPLVPEPYRIAEDCRYRRNLNHPVGTLARDGFGLKPSHMV